MDAGEKIPFVFKFEFSKVSLPEKQEVTLAYEALAKELWGRFNGSIKFQSGLYSKVQELPLIVDFPDGSYLHVLISSYYTVGARAAWEGADIREILDSEQQKTRSEVQFELDQGYIDEVKHPTIHITEHAPDSKILHRVAYGYSYVEKAVIRHDVSRTGASYQPLSVIRLMGDIAQAMTVNSDIIGQLENEHANAELAYDLEVNDKPISIEEFMMVEDLLRTSNLYAYEA